MQNVPRNAFTLTELLIVIALIVLVLVLALPALNVMTGSRSVEAAANQLSAVLGQARADALGLQKVTGVLFYIEPATDRVHAVLVTETPNTTTAHGGFVYLDRVVTRDAVALPVGVGLHTIDNAVLNANDVRQDDGYIGYNPIPSLDNSRVGGVILFDGAGRLAFRNYSFILARNGVPTEIARLLHPNPPNAPPVGGTTPFPTSAVGFVLFDRTPFRDAGWTEDDANFSYTQPERDEEQWLDDNTAPFLINRYNGTLIRGE